MLAKQILKNTLESVIKDLFDLTVSFEIERPLLALHGDYTTNIALIISRTLHKTPLFIAEKISLALKDRKLTGIEKIEVVRPGFINIFLARGYFLDILRNILEQKDKFGTNNLLDSQKTIVEFADPNPFKEFHIGHLRNITIGESLSRLLEANGAIVWRVNYQGDVGMHVAKALYGLLQILKLKSEDTLDRLTLLKRVEILGQAYAWGAKAYEEDNEAKREIQELNIKIYRKDPSIMHLWEKGRAWSLEQFERVYKRVYTVYNRYYFESQTAGLGRELVLSHIDDGIFVRSEKAVVYKGEQDGLHTRVFITKEDYPTYEAKDLALAKLKYEDFVYDRSIIITAHEQESYFKVVLAAMRKVLPDLAAKTEHHTFGFVSLKEGKMSSRSGNIITAMWLLDEAKRRIKKAFPEMDGRTAEMVAVGAVKYSMLRFSRESDIAFSFAESISLEGNSGPYLQYAFVRTQSVLSKAENAKEKIQQIWQKNLANWEMEVEERQVLRLLAWFPDIVEEAAEKLAPNILCEYLFNLAQIFNLFYQKYKIIGSRQEPFRLALSQATGQVLKNGLYLLGILAPERM
jgi:arginyl-tRNA synthetase